MPGTTSPAGRTSTSTGSASREPGERLLVGAQDLLHGRLILAPVHLTTGAGSARAPTRRRRCCTPATRRGGRGRRWRAARPRTPPWPGGRPRTRRPPRPRVAGTRRTPERLELLLADRVGVDVDRVAGLEPPLDPFEAGGQGDGRPQVEVAGAVGDAQLQAAPVHRQPAHQGAVVVAVGPVHRRPGDLVHQPAGQHPLVGVDRRADHGGDRPGVLQHPGGELVGELAVAAVGPVADPLGARLAALGLEQVAPDARRRPGSGCSGRPSRTPPTTAWA